MMFYLGKLPINGNINGVTTKGLAKGNYVWSFQIGF